MLSPLKIFWTVIIFFLASQISVAQSDPAMDKKWADILTQYQSAKLNDTSYFAQVDILANQSYKDTALKEKLNFFKSLAWSNQDYAKFRLRYYLYLYNNALYAYRAGASIYYMEKAEDERKKITPYINSLQGSVALLFNYGRTRSGYTKCFEEYNRILPFLKELPQKIKTDSVPVVTMANAMALLTDITNFYTELNDTAAALQACTYSENIRNSFKKRMQYTDLELHRPVYSYYLMKSTQQRLLHHTAEARKMLDTALAIVYSVHDSNEYLWRNAANSDMFLNYFNFFMEQKQTDSAEHYLQLVKKGQEKAVADLGDGTAYLFNNGTLKAMEGDYKTAYENILTAYNINDSVIGVKTADINNNMYAQALAEDKSAALQEAEALQHKRNILIAVISAISLIVIILLYVRIKIKERKAKESIDKLSYASRLQIMELEEKNLLVKQEEQKRLGMDLHDDLAGSIAAAKVKIESELFNNQDAAQVERLKTVSKMMTDIYESTRNKSHQLYHGVGIDSEISFSKRIQLITENSFTSDKYTITIDVDDVFMKEVDLKIKIQMLYIIQEAVTNIIKYSMASTISILIYEDIDEVLILQITDNGKGFNAVSSRKGVGLNSMQERASAVNGTIVINSGNTGTEITVSIPK